MRVLIPMVLAAGCATGAPSYGVVTFKSYADLAAPPVQMSVGKGEIVGSDFFDLREDDGCIRGTYGRIPLDFCRDDKTTGPEEHWSGASGDFTVLTAGDHLAVRGQMILDEGRIVWMDQDVPVGKGAQWDELMRHPAMLAVAATAADLRVARIR